MSTVVCPVCGHHCNYLNSVDFNKSCEDRHGSFLSPADIPISYYICPHCQFCFAPECMLWDKREFQEKIYNKDYAVVDPEHEETRPRRLAGELNAVFQGNQYQIKHLDFGGGNGLMSKLLRAMNWQSSSFDPFFEPQAKPDVLSKFNLITAFEVFEHHPHPHELINTLYSYLAPGGLILFTTLVSDREIVPGRELAWWYAAPRNGHISLYSSKSLALLGNTKGFRFVSFSNAFHAYFTQVPAWARHLIRVT